RKGPTAGYAGSDASGDTSSALRRSAQEPTEETSQNQRGSVGILSVQGEEDVKNEILLPTGPSPDLARRRQAARKNPPSPVASVHSLLVWLSRREHGRNPRFPNTRREGRRAGGTASSCSNRFRVMPPAFPATRHDA